MGPACVVLRSRIVLLAGDGRLLLVRQPGLNTGLIKASRGSPRSGRVFRDVCNCGGDEHVAPTPNRRCGDEVVHEGLYLAGRQRNSAGDNAGAVAIDGVKTTPAYLL